jgi:oxygen-dependent protoporphyrinogen oxidase
MIQPTGRKRVAVIGGGIAGLTAGLAVVRERPDVDVTVFEGASEVGGKLKLGEIAGVQVDLGAESILNRRPEGVELAKEVGLAESIVHPATTAAGIWTREAVRPLPRTLMGIPADLGGAARSGIVSRAGVLRASVEPLLPAPSLREDVGVGVFVARRLGPEIRDRLVEPMLGGVYAGRADETSLHAALPQVVASVETHGSLVKAARAATSEANTSSNPPVFAGLDGGVGMLAVATADALVASGGTVETDTMVRELSQTPAGWRLVLGPTASTRVVDADLVIVAVPGRPAARLLKGAAPDAARELDRIEYASMAIVTVAFDARHAGPALTGSGFLVPPVDGRIVKATTFSSRKWAWLTGDVEIVRCSIGRFREEAELQRPDTELVEAAVLNLRDAVGLHARVLDAHVTRWGGALPQYAVGHLDRVRRVNEALARIPGLEICGAAYDGVGIAAVVATARRAATRVVATLGPAETMDA